MPGEFLAATSCNKLPFGVGGTLHVVDPAMDDRDALVPPPLSFTVSVRASFTVSVRASFTVSVRASFTVSVLY